MTRCPLCGRRLYRDESQLSHEYSGRCLRGGTGAPPAKVPVAPEDINPPAPKSPRRRPTRTGMSREQYLESVRSPHGTVRRSRRCKAGEGGGRCDPCTEAYNNDAREWASKHGREVA